MMQSALAMLKRAANRAVENEGLRAFADRTGVPLGVVRGAQRGQNLTAASIAKLTKALDFDFYVGPRSLRPSLVADRRSSEFAAGMAEEPAIFRMTASGCDAWAALDRPAPDGAFFLQRGAGAGQGDCYYLVQPEVEMLIGELVYLEDREGRVATGEYQGTGPASGWIKVLRHGAAMADERAPGSLRRIAAITWAGRTPPPAIMSGLVNGVAQLPKQGKLAKSEIDEILTEMRERLMRVVE